MSKFNLDGWELREVKSNPLTDQELEEMHVLTLSYESLFSKRSSQIKMRGLILQDLTEEDYRNLLLAHYTFLKRPIFLTDKEIFVGNAKHTIDDLEMFFNRK